MAARAGRYLYVALGRGMNLAPVDVERPTLV